MSKKYRTPINKLDLTLAFECGTLECLVFSTREDFWVPVGKDWSLDIQQTLFDLNPSRHRIYLGENSNACDGCFDDNDS